MAATEKVRGFVPYGELKPDLRYLVNDGLLRAEGVVPVHGDYISSPAIDRISASIAADLARGLHVDQLSGVGYAAVGNDLYSITEAGVVTNVSRAAAYTPASFCRGCNFGQTVVMTNYDDEVQYFPAGAVDFANMITSTFLPRARFCFVLRSNLFLANCNLPGGYDGLSAGANPTLVAWSRNEVPRSFGSLNANPELTGAGYQPLNFDIGDITAGIGGADYGIVGHSNGIVRVDGPPYTFRVITRNHGVLFPYGICVADHDIYVWTAAGIGRLRGGEGPIEILGINKWVRFLIDNSTGFSRHPMATIGGLSLLESAQSVSMAHDPINNILFIAYSEIFEGAAQLYSKALLAYNINEDRLSWFQIRDVVAADAQPAFFLSPGRQFSPSSWVPGRDIRFLNSIDSISDDQFYTKFAVGNSFGNSVLQKGYTQINQYKPARLLRVRPIYAVTDAAAAQQISVEIETVNKPYATVTTDGPYSTVDTDGWIVTPTTHFGWFHAPRFTFAANAAMHKLVEYQGYEYEAVLQGGYAG